MAVAKGTVSPGPKAKSPGRKPKSPGPNVKSPGPNVKSPGPKGKSPGPKGKSPGPKGKSPGPKGKSPVQQPKSPGQQPKSLGQQPKSPGQNIKTPKKGPSTPKVKAVTGTPKQDDTKSVAVVKPVTPNVQKKQQNKPNQAAPKPNPEGKKSAKKRSATEAGLKQKSSEPTEKKREVQPLRKVPNCYKKISLYETQRGVSEDDRTVRFFNLPDVETMDDNTLARELLVLLKKLGEIEERRFETSEKRIFRVVFKSMDDALAAKKLNGALLGDRHICVTRFDDGYMHSDKKVVVKNLPQGVTDDDIWQTFSGCGKLYSLHLRRHDNDCILTFWTKDGQLNALKSKKKCKDNTLEMQEYGRPLQWRTVIISNLKDVNEEDVQKFVKGIGPVESIKMNEKKSFAQVAFANELDVIKAFSLNGKQLNGQKVELLVHAHSFLRFVESKKGTKQDEVEELDDAEDDEDEEDDEEDDDEEDEDEEDDDDDEEEEEEGDDNDDDDDE